MNIFIETSNLMNKNRWFRDEEKNKHNTDQLQAWLQETDFDGVSTRSNGMRRCVYKWESSNFVMTESTLNLASYMFEITALLVV